MCAMRTTIICQTVSICPHFQVAPTGRAPLWQWRPHLQTQQDRWALAKRLLQRRGPSRPCVPCAHR